MLSNAFRKNLAPLSSPLFSSFLSQFTFVRSSGEELSIPGRSGETVKELLENSDAGVSIGVCGGDLACGQCQVYVDSSWMDKLPAIADDEEETLGIAFKRKKQSRLSCALKWTDEWDGLVLHEAPLKPKKTKGKKPKKSSSTPSDKPNASTAPNNATSPTSPPVCLKEQAGQKVSDKVYCIGAVDWSLRDFHDFQVREGGTYNSYFIKDDFVAVIDPVKYTFADGWVERIKSLLQGSGKKEPDFIIVNHAEPDHSSGIVSFMRAFEGRPTVVCNKLCKESLEKLYPEAHPSSWNYRIVKSGDELKLSKDRTLHFLNTPMVHWPESMFTYDAKDGILFSMDAFGQHYPSSARFDDEVPSIEHVLQDAKTYYANILFRLSKPIKATLKKTLSSFEGLQVIAPSHGVVWRKYVNEILQKYVEWVSHKPSNKVVIAYDTMWHATEKMAESIYDGAVLADTSCDVRLMNIRSFHHTDIVTEMLDAPVLALGCPTMHHGMMPAMGGLISYLKGLLPPGHGKMGCAFGSFGWEPTASNEIESAMKSFGIEIVHPAIDMQFTPTQESIGDLRQIGVELANKAKKAASDFQLSF
uniref:Flavoprotein A/ ferredoxin n=2 Tax=Stygiella incarcerata TaxID=1712417 RepID=A0A192ZJF7_9EUKA|nr:flavoprotein A/ ferredoxin [Stygiella incarcerata]